MSRYQEAVEQLKQILLEQPREPYTGRKRRPNGYASRAEYILWEENRLRWSKRILEWHRNGLSVDNDGDRAEVLLYGATVPGVRIEKQPDGWLRYEEPGADPEERAPAIRLPGVKESLETVFEYDHKYGGGWWNLKTFVTDMLRQDGVNVSYEYTRNNNNGSGLVQYDRELNHICDDLRDKWAEAVRDLVDHKAVSRLRKWTGQKANYDLRNHNLSLLSQGPLMETAAANPGALGWWMFSYEHPERKSRLEPPELPPFPRHPGEIIGVVRQEYAEAGGKHWKALAAQPADHVAVCLRKHGRKAVAWLSGPLSEARLPGRTETLTEQQENRESRRRQAQTDFMPLMPPPEPPPVKKELKAAPGKSKQQQPPLEIKLILLELYGQNRGDFNRRHNFMGQLNIRGNRTKEEQEQAEAAIRRVAALACRNYAGKPGMSENSRRKDATIREFQDLSDFLFDSPEQAARAGTWDGLKKAGRRWHGERNLMALRQKLAEEKEKRAMMLKDWETPLQEYRSPRGFRARVLTSSDELIEESVRLSHCVGSISYADQCVQGTTRIVHIDPPPEWGGIEDYNPGEPPGTTLEISLVNNQWADCQHRGYMNRPPENEERTWAAEFLEVWREAIEKRRQEILAQEEAQEAQK